MQEGELQDNKFNGYSHLVSADGELQEGQWKSDIYLGPESINSVQGQMQ